MKYDFPIPKNDKEREKLLIYIYEQQKKNPLLDTYRGLSTGYNISFQDIMAIDKSIRILKYYFDFFNNQE